MKRFMKSIVLIFILTIGILFSYTVLPFVMNYHQTDSFYSYLNKKKLNLQGVFHKEIEEFRTSEEKKTSNDKHIFRGVWITYQEFNAYRNSVEENNERNFREFFRHILKKSQELHLNTVIVQVRPYADAMYPSKYYPWSAYISGKEGDGPDYDPLEVMVEESHNYNMSIEAWINPYRVSSSDYIDALPEDSIAKKWASSTDKCRNILTFEGQLYFNPSSEDVQKLIVNGVEEIVRHYDVDGIHMDDYFYPEFSEEEYDAVFDITEYADYIEEKGDAALGLADWRRQNVNTLVRKIYKTVHKAGKRFGISPAGNPDNLRSETGYYVDIDTWITKKGYVDYILPQLYWGFTNKIAPFEKMLSLWESLAAKSKTDLYVGIQLYKIGSDDQSQTDYKELQSGDFVNHQIVFLQKEKLVKGYALFSYQYLDVDNATYQFETCKFPKERKAILLQNIDYLK